MKKELDLVTCSYSAYRPEMGLPVAISVGLPKWFKFPYHVVKPLAPYGIFNNEAMKEAGRGARHAAYKQRLDIQQTDMFKQLWDLTEMYPDVPLVMMCYENVHKGEVCHRRWAADWFLSEHGIIVPEVSLPPQRNDNAKLLRDPEPPPLTLF